MGTPNATDCNIIYAVNRQTNTGLASVATPNPIFPSDAASVSFAQVNFTSEPTVNATSTIWMRSLNQRASMQWTAPDQDANLLWPATASAGLVGMSLSTTYNDIAFWGFEFEDL